MDASDGSFASDVATLCQAIRIAHALADAGRVLDLSGLDHMVGRLCARALDVGPGYGPAVRPLLRTLLEDVQALEAAISIAGPPSPEIRAAC